MDKEMLKLLIAQQVVILKRFEKLEYKISGGGRSAPAQAYVKELKKEAEKIINQIDVE